MDDRLSLSRRRFLQGGALVVGFSLFPVIEGFAGSAGTSKPVSVTDVDSFLAIDAKGHVTVYSGKVVSGRASITAFTQSRRKNSTFPSSR